jgi:RNase adaptor protein for sRNA GlmZ degradation
MHKSVIVFINGLSGTGKTSLVKYFSGHPIDGWKVHDFDFGKYPIPKDRTMHREWRNKQQEYWLQVGLDNRKTVVFGFSLWPEIALTLPSAKKYDSKNIHFALLYTKPEERKSRLLKASREHLWRGHQDWYDEFYQKVRDKSELEIDTTKLTTGEVAKRIRPWLNNL